MTSIKKQTSLPGFITPQYEGLSLYNVTQTILQACGSKIQYPLLPEFFDPKILNGIKNIILLCSDGFGYNQLQHTKFMKKMSGFPITTITPSATTAALSTLASGLTPQEHGILGLTVFLRELGYVTNMLSFGPSFGLGSFADMGIDPEIFFPFQTLYRTVAKKCIKPFIFNKVDYANSPFSQMIYRGGDVLQYRSLTDLFSRAHQVLSRPGRKFLYLYWDMVDTSSHMHGPQSDKCRKEIKHLDAHLETFLEKIKAKNTLFLFTADHGVLPTQKTIDLLHHPKLLDNVQIDPTGEWGRIVYLHAKKGKKEKVSEYLHSEFGEKCLILESKDALEKGLFGIHKPFAETSHRLGDFILLPKKQYSFTYPFFSSKEVKGRHGGLSEEEMIIPLLWKRF